eukprot:3731426-Prymnesium_polylepis.1
MVSAVVDTAVARVLIAPGTYTFTTHHVRSSTALCLNRDMTIEVAVPGTVVLDAGGSSSAPRRMFYIFG